MPLPSLRPPSSASNATRYNPISSSNSTANAFLGGATKSWMRTGTTNAPAQTSPPTPARRRRPDLPPSFAPSESSPAAPKNPVSHQPPGLQSSPPTSNAGGSILPSPALTNEPSPSTTTQHVSPDMRNAASHSVSAEATSRIEAYFEPIGTSNTTTSPEIIENTQSQLRMAPRPSTTRWPRVSPTQGEMSPVQLSAHASSGPGESAASTPSTGDKRRQNPGEQDGTQSGQPTKRSRLSTGTASQGIEQQNGPANAMAGYVRALDRRIEESGPLELSTEQPRYNYLRDACMANDGFYVVLHQVFCIWSMSDDFDKQMLPSTSQQGVSTAFRLLSQILRSNDTMSRDHLSWFARFPDLCDKDAGSLRDTHLHHADHFLAALSSKWSLFLKDVQRRGYPLIAHEALNVLGCKSQILCGTLFTVSRRVLEVPDRYCAELHNLFTQDYYAELHSDPNVATSRVEQISKYKSLVQQACNRVPQHGQNCNSALASASPARAPAPSSTSQVPPETTASSPQVLLSAANAAPASPSGMSTRPQNAGQLQQEQPEWTGTVRRPQHQQSYQSGYVQPQVNDQSAQVPQQARAAAYSQTRPPSDQLSQRSMSGGALPQPTVFPPQPSSYQHQNGIRQPHQHPSLGVHNHPDQIHGPSSPTHSTWTGYPHGHTFGPDAAQQTVVSPHAQFPNHLPMQAQPSYSQHPQQRSSPLQGSSYQSNSPSLPQNPRIPPQGYHRHPNTSMRPSTSTPQAHSVHTAGVPPPIPSATTHHNHHPSRHSASQPSIRQIPVNDFPAGPYDWTSMEIAAHLPQLRSPLRRPAKGVSGPHLQYVNGWCWKPFKIEPRIGKVSLNFMVTEHDLQKLATKGEDPSGLSVRFYSEGSRRYRLRCCRLPSNVLVTESSWATTGTTWPQEMYLFLNQKPVDIPRKQHFHNDLPVELTDFLIAGNNDVTICIPPNKCNLHPTSSFYLALESILTTSLAQARLEVVEKNPRVAAHTTAAEIARRLKPDESDDVIVDDNTLTISLADPFSSVMCEVPVRGLTCKHLECFDLDIWLSTRRGKSSHAKTSEPSLTDGWKCPICDGDARPSSLCVDEFFVQVRTMLLANGLQKVKKIKVSHNGSWVPIPEPDDDDDDDEGTNAAPFASAVPTGHALGIPEQPSRQSNQQSSRRAPVEVIEIDD